MHAVITYVAASQAGTSPLQRPSATPVLAGWLSNHCSAEGAASMQQSVGLVPPRSRLAALALLCCRHAALPWTSLFTFLCQKHCVTMTLFTHSQESDTFVTAWTCTEPVWWEKRLNKALSPSMPRHPAMQVSADMQRGKGIDSGRHQGLSSLVCTELLWNKAPCE